MIFNLKKDLSGLTDKQKEVYRLLFYKRLPALILFWIGFIFLFNLGLSYDIDVFFIKSLTNFFDHIFASIFNNNQKTEAIITAIPLMILIFGYGAFIVTYPIYWIENKIRDNIIKEMIVNNNYEKTESGRQLKMEQEAKKNLGIDEESGAVDKSDIRYWHGLLKDGIIDQTEFDMKKAELI